MGERLHAIINALQQRMDTGVLHDLNITRLNMLIGDQLVKRSLDLPDDDPYIELIEQAMQAYFNMNIEEPEEEEDTPEKVIKEAIVEDTAVEDETTPGPTDLAQKQDVNSRGEMTPSREKTSSTGPINFKLNIKRDEDTNRALINQAPFLFSPVAVRQILSSTVINALSDIPEPGPGGEEVFAKETLLKGIEESACVKTIQLLTDVFSNLRGEVTFEQKIRLGLVIYRLFGYGNFKLDIGESAWEITLNYGDEALPDMDYFSLGFIRGIFVAADDEMFNKLHFSFFKNEQSTIITGSWENNDDING